MKDPAAIIAILLINALAATVLSLLLAPIMPEAIRSFIGPTLAACGATWICLYIWRSADHG